MTLKQLLDSLKGLEKEYSDDKKTLFKAMLTALSDYLSEAFCVYQDEIALIMKDRDNFSSFVLPINFLNKGNSFPVSKATVTKDVFEKGRPVMSNNASKVYRLSFYEMAKATAKKPVPIQKFISVPLKHENSVFAVLWISRRGSNLQEAGKDFTETDISNTEHLMSIIEPFLYRAKPECFV
jgi:transcriptional regulator with GAF, ATPase, and Fis domain